MNRSIVRWCAVVWMGLMLAPTAACGAKGEKMGCPAVCQKNQTGCRATESYLQECNAACNADEQKADRSGCLEQYDAVGKCEYQSWNARVCDNGGANVLCKQEYDAFVVCSG